MANLLRYGFVREQSTKKVGPRSTVQSEKSKPASVESTVDESNTNATVSFHETNSKRKVCDSDYLTKDQKYDKLKRQRKFQDHWTTVWPWLRYDDDNCIMFCRICRDNPDIANKSSQLFKGTDHFKVDPLKSHEKTKEHMHCMTRGTTAVKPKAKIVEAFTNISSQKYSSLTALFNTAYAVLKGGRPFTDYEFICAVQLKNNIELGQNYLNRFACRRFLSPIVNVIRKRIQDEIKSVNFLSVLADGSTDAGVVEQEIVYVRYVHPVDRTPKTTQVDIVSLSSANSSGVFEAVETGLKTVDLTFGDLKHDSESCKSKLVAVNFDGAAVMMGQRSGVAKKITDIVPESLVLHCVAHKLELAALDANKSAKYMVTFEETIKGIFGFYHYSPKRRRELYEICSVLDEVGAHFSNVKQVRWLSSKERAVKALAVNLPAVIMHLQSSEADRAHGYLREVTSVTFVKHLYFMLDYLPLLATLSRAFQQENLLIMELPDHIECTLIALSALKSTPGKNMKLFNQMYNPTEMKFGEVVLSGRKPGAIDITKDSNIIQIIDNTVTYIQNRFKALNVAPLNKFSVLDFHKWPIHTAELGTFGNTQIHDLVHIHMKSCFSDTDRECIDREWILLKMFIRPLRSNDLVDVYSGLLRLNNPALTHVVKVVELTMAISPSTASCERGFSNMNNVKNCLRTQLTQESLRDQLQVMCEGPPLQDFNADEAIKDWLNSTTGNRHIHGHARPSLKDGTDTDNNGEILIDNMKK